MKNNYAEILRVLISKYRLEQKAIADKAGINENTLGKILSEKTSPTVRTLDAVLDACEDFVPGFRLEYHRAMLGDKIDLDEFISSLNPTELAMVLITAGKKVAKLQPTVIAS